MTAPDQAFYDFEFTHSKTGHPHMSTINGGHLSTHSMARQCRQAGRLRLMLRRNRFNLNRQHVFTAADHHVIDKPDQE